jgi:hypothetical protein
MGGRQFMNRRQFTGGHKFIGRREFKYTGRFT